MPKKMRIGNEKYFQIIKAILCILLSIISVICISKVNTVWELIDEAGYLSNTAYFIGAQWDSIHQVSAYFGYGYSILLIPVYLLVNTGLSLIRGSLVVNACMLISLFFLLLKVIREVVEINEIAASLIAFYCSISPYLISNLMKVNCEVCVSFCYVLSIVLFIKTIKSNSFFYDIALAASVAYLYAIHIRMIIQLFIFSICFLLSNRKSKKRVIIYCCVLVLFMIPVLLIKNQIINYRSLTRITQNEIPNTITPGVLQERLGWIMDLTNVKLYIIALLVKIFYVNTSTFGLLFVGVRRLILECKKNNSEKIIVILLLLTNALATVLGALFMGVGYLDNFASICYSRYYECTIIPLVAIIMGTIIMRIPSRKEIFLSVLIEAFLFLGVMQLSPYLINSKLNIDTARMPGWSFFIHDNTDFKLVIVGIAVVCIFILLLLGLPYKKAPYIVAVLIFVINAQGVYKCADFISKVNEKAVYDNEIANYCYQNRIDHVYMIDDGAYSNKYYVRMQCLLKDIPLVVLRSEETSVKEKIVAGEYFCVYENSQIMQDGEFGYNSTMIIHGSTVDLYRKLE